MAIIFFKNFGALPREDEEVIKPTLPIEKPPELNKIQSLQNALNDFYSRYIAMRDYWIKNKSIDILKSLVQELRNLERQALTLFDETELTSFFSKLRELIQKINDDINYLQSIPKPPETPTEPIQPETPISPSQPTTQNEILKTQFLNQLAEFSSFWKNNKQKWIDAKDINSIQKFLSDLTSFANNVRKVFNETNFPEFFNNLNALYNDVQSTLNNIIIIDVKPITQQPSLPPTTIIPSEAPKQPSIPSETPKPLQAGFPKEIIFIGLVFIALILFSKIK